MQQVAWWHQEFLPYQVLKYLAMREVNDILHALLQIIYAKTVLCKERSSLEKLKTILMKAYILIVKDYVDLFYFPKYSEAHSQLEPRTTDYTHMVSSQKVGDQNQEFWKKNLKVHRLGKLTLLLVHTYANKNIYLEFLIFIFFRFYKDKFTLLLFFENSNFFY